MKRTGIFILVIAAAMLALCAAGPAAACTGIRLIAKDGSTAYGRSMEWGRFDLNSEVTIIPRGYSFTGQTPDGYNGKKWKSEYGVVALNMLGKMALADGLNEKGLAGGLFYHPGFAEYAKYQKSKAGETIAAQDVLTYMLTKFATIDEVRRGMREVRVAAVYEPAIGKPVPAHWMVTEASGKSIVIEYAGGKLRVFDNPLGVITNSPTYDWHMTNIRNYLNLSAVSLPSKKIASLNFTPLGGGSGMIGLPGDNTPPSRLVRAVAWTQTHRPLPDSREAIYEVFRILDNFNLPLGAAEGSGNVPQNLKGMRSSTIWTTAWDVSGKKLYFHTQHNRRVRMVDLNKIDFSGKKIRHLKLDQKKEQDIKDITPAR